MKKLYSFLALSMLALASQAADLKFWIGSTEITPGQTVTYNKVETDDLGGTYEVKMAPSVYVSSSTANTLTITAVCTSGQFVNMCCGGQCKSGTTVVKDNISVAANQKLNLDFDWIEYFDDLSALPVITTDFTATDGSASASFKLVMDPATSSLTLIETGDAISYGPEGISYFASAPSQLSLYSITGAQVLSTRVDGQGTISTHSLRPGLYIYSLRGAVKLTGKIYVK